MARQRPEKKREPAPPATSRVLPVEFQVGDRFSDETGEWEVVSRPYTSAAGKTAAFAFRGSASLTSPICGRGARTSASP
jgi:hypothetical protein